MQLEILEEICAERGGVELEKIDATQNTDLANTFSVRSFPTTVLTDDSESRVIDRFTGLHQKEDIESSF